MRIRTLKPDFWTNDRMAAQSEFTQLLAIALLNFADDDGFFLANPAIIRGAVFPFHESSRKITLGLRELANIGYILYFKGSDSRDYAQIKHFAIHQKINHHNPSKIKDLCNLSEPSLNPTGVLREASLPEWNGMEGEREGNKEVDSGNGTLRLTEPTTSGEPSASPGLVSGENQKESQKFVDWFLKLLTETSAPVPDLSQTNRNLWAQTYNKMLRLDGRTKEQIKEVCTWARNDSFWKDAFFSPTKLRDKKDGVMYFDKFIHKKGSTKDAQKVGYYSGEELAHLRSKYDDDFIAKLGPNFDPDNSRP